MGDSLENNTLEPSSDDHSTSIIDIGVFLSYLRRVVTLLFQEEGEDINVALSTAIEDRAHLEAIKKFISDSQVSSLFIQRGITKGKKVITNWFVEFITVWLSVTFF